LHFQCSNNVDFIRGRHQAIKNPDATIFLGGPMGTTQLQKNSPTKAINDINGSSSISYF